MYYDLATIEDLDDNTVITNINELGRYIWIGLYDDMARWKWAMGNEAFNNNLDFENWAIYEPTDLRSEESCTTITAQGIWYDVSCGKLRYAVCYHGKKNFH